MIDGNGTQRILGAHEQAIEDIRDDIAALQADVKPVLEWVNRQKGAKAAVFAMAGAVSTAVSLLIAYWSRP